MTPLDTELFNEFKRLDKLLRESRRTERGVSDYIDEMKKIGAKGAQCVPNWRLDLDRLWYCRHIRNKLAHDDTSETYSLCDEKYVEFLKDFYARVLNGTDPLAQWHKHRQAARSAATPPPRAYTYSPSPASAQQGCLSCVIWTAVAALAIPCTMTIIRLLT